MDTRFYAIGFGPGQFIRSRRSLFLFVYVIYFSRLINKFFNFLLCRSGIGTLYNQIEYYLDKKAFFIGLCYFCVSFCLPFLNKTVLTVFNFNYLFFILSLQMIATLIMIDIASVTGLIKVKHIGKLFKKISVT